MICLLVNSFVNSSLDEQQWRKICEEIICLHKKAENEYERRRRAFFFRLLCVATFAVLLLMGGAYLMWQVSSWDNIASLEWKTHELVEAFLFVKRWTIIKPSVICTCVSNDLYLYMLLKFIVLIVSKMHSNEAILFFLQIGKARLFTATCICSNMW